MFKGVKRLTYKTGGQPNWSPRAKAIAFTRNGNIHRMGADAKNVKKLTGNGGLDPAWRPSGKSILFERSDSGNQVIYAVTSDGSSAKFVTGGEEGRGTFVFSPDQQAK